MTVVVTSDAELDDGYATMDVIGELAGTPVGYTNVEGSALVVYGTYEAELGVS